MDDLISRQAAIEAFEELIRARRGWLTDARGEIQGINASYCAIVDLPSAVVRCKDCKWCEDLDVNGWCWCGNDGCGMPRDGFCSYGEKERK